VSPNGSDPQGNKTKSVNLGWRKRRKSVEQVMEFLEQEVWPLPSGCRGVSPLCQGAAAAGGAEFR